MPPEYSTLVFAGAALGISVFLSASLLFYVIHHVLSWMKGGADDD